MAIPITIPRLGWDMEEGVFLGWLKADGAQVHAGDMLFTLESDKSTEEIECHDSGILRIAPSGPRSGDKLAVGAVIGYLVQEGEAIPASTAAVQTSAATTSPQQSPPPKPATAARQAGPSVSPRARRIAAELGIDWTALKGTGRTGRIREQDVRSALKASAKPSLAGAAGSSEPVTKMRRTIAERMLASQKATAAVTLTTAVDAGNLVSLRNQARLALQAGHDLVPSYTDFLVKLTSFALQKHPLLNASWVDDRIVYSQTIDIGIAVNLDDGLVVPVLRNVGVLGLRQVSAESRRLIERARAGQLKAEEMQHGTFTLTNLGAFGVDAFTPIIHFPQCAILGVGRIRRRPAVVGQDREEIVIRDEVTLSLTFDHRVVDGAPAAQFLQTLSLIIENPGPWLMT